tara:strand:+ start:141 stop:413 length:273 start_codon:yes stop_codon:yes gene_type:complete
MERKSKIHTLVKKANLFEQSSGSLFPAIPIQNLAKELYEAKKTFISQIEAMVEVTSHIFDITQKKLTEYVNKSPEKAKKLTKPSNIIKGS